MSDGYGDLERARQHVDPMWSGRKIEAELGRLEAQVEAHHKGRVARVLVISLSAACAAALGLSWATASREPAPLATQTAPAQPRAMQQVTAPPQVVSGDREPGPSVTQNDAQRVVEGSTTSKDAGAEEPLRARTSRVKVAASTWRALARDGRYQEAYRAMRGSEPDRMRAEVDDLLLAGDAARLSGHAREAVPYYRAALDKAGKDPRAHLAAFTLGRTLLHDLREPRAAAEAFARAHRAAPRGPLAEEALAREVESWSRAGDVARARAAAVRYEETYPQGRLRSEVKRYGGLP